MIELRHLKKTYENAEPLKDVSVTVNDGDVIAVIGPSGTGKSTLLRCINLLEKPGCHSNQGRMIHNIITGGMKRMNIYQKLTALALTAVMALGCAACGGQQTRSETASPTSEPEAEITVPASAAPVPTEEPAQELATSFSPDGSVIFERDGVKVTTAGLDTDPTSGDNDPIIISYNYISEPVIIKTGETVADVDIKSLGTAVIDDEKMTLVFGEQDYDDFFGPEFAVYCENKTDKWIGLRVEKAEGGGVSCEDAYGGVTVAPGKKDAGSISFDGEMRELKGIENLTITYRYFEADSDINLLDGETALLDPVTVTYPPQAWGAYENAGYVLNIKPRINELITVETPGNDPDGMLFTVSETASLEAGGHEGAGWIFSIGKVSADRFHEILQSDMSGEYVFAKDASGDYYMIYHPTDVRYERATAEEMRRDQAQWTMLNEWVDTAETNFIEDNEGLEGYYRGNTPVEMYLARAAWQEGVNATLSTTEYGPVALTGVDGTPYAEFVMDGHFFEADAKETPDSQYVSLDFPEDGTRLDFFFAPGGYVRYVSGDYEALYEAAWEDDNITCAEAMQGWYYALAELAGVKPFDPSLEHYYGLWYEKIAGRGEVDISWCVAPGKVNIMVRWPESASVSDTWKLTARLEDGRLVYEYGQWEKNEYDENGEETYLDGSWEESGWFELSGSELIWHDGNAEHGGDSTFIK